MIKNEETGWTEATIVVNGQTLNFAEALTVRVALENYAMWLSNDDTREMLGPIGDGYTRAIDSTMRKIHGR